MVADAVHHIAQALFASPGLVRLELRAATAQLVTGTRDAGPNMLGQQIAVDRGRRIGGR